MTSSKRSGSSRPPLPDGFSVGRLVAPHGLRGEIKLYPTTDYPEQLANLKTVRLRFADGTEEERALTGIREQKGMFFIRLAGCADRPAAEALRGVEVWIREDQAPPLPEGQFYLHEIVGLRAVTEDGEELGTVDEVLKMPANDVYRVGRLLVPATRDAVRRLDPSEGILVTAKRAYLEGEAPQ